MSKLAIVVAALLAAFAGGVPVFAEEAISERCVCGLSAGAGAFNAGRPLFADLADAPVNERESGIDDDHVRTPRPLPRHHRRSADTHARSID
jgi:hypothetical protein